MEANEYKYCIESRNYNNDVLWVHFEVSDKYIPFSLLHQCVLKALRNIDMRPAIFWH